jgi:hypothetical protein
MKKFLVTFCLMAMAASTVPAQGNRQPNPPKSSPPPPPPVVLAPTAPSPRGAFVYQQRPVQGQQQLVSSEQAQAIIDRFKEAYPKLGSPRMLIYVNRELVDEQSGMKLTSRTQRTDTTRNEVKTDFPDGTTAQTTSNSISVAGGGVTVNTAPGALPSKGSLNTRSDKVAAEERYRLHERQQTLADRQTLRDVERLFGRPLRSGGVSLADQRLATQLMPARPIEAFTSAVEGDAARKDREALARITDVVLEVLISSRNITVPGISGDRTQTVPDIQATALRLSDAAILGQASSTDVLGPGSRNTDVRQVAEATALALMEDMMTGME